MAKSRFDCGLLSLASIAMAIGAAVNCACNNLTAAGYQYNGNKNVILFHSALPLSVTAPAKTAPANILDASLLLLESTTTYALSD
jgi:hypothetical protein